VHRRKKKVPHTFGSNIPCFRTDKPFQKCDGGVPSCRKCLESRGVVECTYRETETVKLGPQAELAIVRTVASRDTPPYFANPPQFSVDPVFNPFDWAPVSLAILDFVNPSSYSLSGISPEDMNLRL